MEQILQLNELMKELEGKDKIEAHQTNILYNLKFCPIRSLT